MNEEFRSVIHFCWLRKICAQEIHKQMQEAYKDKCYSIDMIYKWIREFNNGRENLHDLPRAGRPISIEKVDAVKNFVENFPSSSCRYIGLQLGIDKNTVKSILTNSLHMKKLLFHWVPHELTLNQKQKRVDICKMLLDTLNTLSWSQLKKIVTCDESWFYLSYKADFIWSTDENTKTFPKRQIGDTKIMLFTSFCCLGPVLIEMKPSNINFTADYFSNIILPKLKANSQNIKGVQKTIKLRIQIDNAKPHVSKLANETMERLNICKLPHPPYSPDVSPNDFFLYGYTKEKHKGSTHSSEKELFDHIVRIINQIDNRF